MKLDNKRTILTGLAFLSICAFWQMYNSIVPLILTNTFHLNETYSGAIMAADNVLALFLLPLFGAISDKTHTKIGKRMPFILFGTGLAIILMNLLPLIDNSYVAAPTTFKTFRSWSFSVCCSWRWEPTVPRRSRSCRTLRPSPCAARATRS